MMTIRFLPRPICILASLFAVLFAAVLQAADRVAPVVLSPLPEKYADDLRLFQGIPSIAAADDQNIWIAWYTGGVTEDRDNYVVVARSRDGGKTWSKPLFAVDQDGEPRQYDPSLWFAPDGKLHLFWSQRPGLTPGADLYTMVCDDPDSENPRWSDPEFLTTGVAMNKGFADSNGRWIVPVSVWRWEAADRSPDGPTGAWALVSEDQGATWTKLGRGYTPIDRSLFDEHSIVELKDGRFWLLNRTATGVGEFFSSDGCRTWSEFKESSIKHTSSRFFIRRLKSGNLIFVKNGPMDKDVGRTNMMAFLSEDDGKTWLGGLLLDNVGYVSYPDGDQSPDGTIHIVYDTERLRGLMEIRVARITEDDIRAGKLVSPNSALRVVANKATGKSPFVFSPDANADGEPFRAGAAHAEFSPTDSKADKSALFETGSLLFGNRSYVLFETPDFLKGRSFLFSILERTSAVCMKGGTAYVVTPAETRNKDSVAAELVRLGFKKAAIPEFLLFGESTANVVTLYQKEVEAGEKIEFGKWGVLIY